jgi:hypothetical protein
MASSTSSWPARLRRVTQHVGAIAPSHAARVGVSDKASIHYEAC